MSNHGSGQPMNPGINYESRDLGAKSIVVFLIVLAISGILIELLVWGMLRFYNKMTVENNVPTAGTAQLYTPRRSCRVAIRRCVFPNLRCRWMTSPT